MMGHLEYTGLITILGLLSLNGQDVTENGAKTLRDRMQYNIWKHMAEMANVTDFCLSHGLSAQEVLATCLVPVCHHPSELMNLVGRDNSVRYKTYWSRGPTTYDLPADAITLSTPHVGSKEATCARIRNCTKNCVTLPGKPLTCSTIHDFSYGPKHQILPDGWWWTCNERTSNFIHGNLTDGTVCCLSRLTLVLPSRSALEEPLPTRQKRTLALNTLDSNCDSQVTLFSHPEILSLAFSLIAVPGLAAANAKQLGKLACWAVKSINHTSTAISLLNREQKELRQSILENRAAVDFLLMKDQLGCQVFKGLCCFNLTDNSKAVDNQLGDLNNLINQIKQRKGSLIDSIWDTLTNWLPDGSWLKHAFVCVLGTVIMIVVLCCCLQCLPNIFTTFKALCRTRKTPVYVLDEVQDIPLQEQAPLSIQVQIWGEHQSEP